MTTRLPALPQVLLRLLELCRDEDSGLDDIARLVGHEPALSARLLALASGADRHGRAAPRNLTQALMQLGLDSVRTAVIGDAIQQVFAGLAGGQDIDLGAFWRHSLGSAILARRLAKAAGYPHVEEAYLAGLLHDVGQLAMLAAFAGEYRRALAGYNDDTWLSRWEESALGFTHAEVGAWLAARWELDGFLADALLYHHEAEAQVAHAHPLVRIVWLAHAMERDAESIPPDLLGCGADTLAGLRDGVADELARAADFLGLRLADPEAQARAQASLAGEVRDLAMVGALRGQPAARPASPASPAERLRATALTARALFGLGDCLYCQVENGRLRPLAPWPHLARGEELAIPVGETGGCVGRAAATGRVGAIRAAEVAAGLLDRQLLRLLAGADDVSALLALPLGGAPPCPVLVFAAPQDTVADLLARPFLLRAYAGEAALRLAPPAPAADTDLRDQIRRAVHEVNNPLGIIKNYLRLLADDLRARPDAGSLADDLGQANAEIERVGRLLRQLAQPAGPEAAPRGSDLNQAVRELLDFCRDSRYVPPGIKVEVTLQDGLDRVMADRDSLKQILLNLLKNGIEAIGAEGRIVVSTAGPFPGRLGREVLLLVSDNGPGLPPEVQASLFKPVATQKGAGHAGLGLAIVGELVARLGGRIECQSGTTGTAFSLYLAAAPVADATP